MSRAIIIAAILAATFGGGFIGGQRWCEGEHAERELIRQSQAKEREAERQIREAELIRTARELEDLANAQPVTADCGLPVDRVRRLNLR